MTTLLTRLDDTRTHLGAEGASMLSRTRRAGLDLARALRAEGDAWRRYLEGREQALREELARLSSPRAAERALLRAADGALERAREAVPARLSLVESELRRARRKRLAAGAARPAPARGKKPAARARARRAATAAPAGLEPS